LNLYRCLVQTCSKEMSFRLVRNLCSEHDLLPVNLKLSQKMFFIRIASLDGFFTKSVTGNFCLLTSGGLISVINSFVFMVVIFLCLNIYLSLNLSVLEVREPLFTTSSMSRMCLPVGRYAQYCSLFFLLCLYNFSGL